MIRNLIGAKHTTELYKVSAEMKRGTVVVKNYTNKTAGKADAVGTELYFVDYNFVPSGIYSDMEISAYTDMADIIKADTLAILIKPQIGETWAVDQVDATGLSAGDHAVAGTTTNVGKLIKAVSGDVSVLRYVGTYDDAGHTLHAFEVVEPKTIA